jgi:hypothetical protein
MVLLERIELSASPLPRECSTSELQQRDHRSARGGGAAAGSGRALQCAPLLSSGRRRGNAAKVMTGGDKLTREERLAQKLRENLRRRKAQSRELAGQKPSLSKEGEHG